MAARKKKDRRARVAHKKVIEKRTEREKDRQFDRFVANRFDTPIGQSKPRGTKNARRDFAEAGKKLFDEADREQKGAGRASRKTAGEILKEGKRRSKAFIKKRKIERKKRKR